MSLEIEILTSTMDLVGVVQQVNGADWDEQNEIELYSVDALKAYLEKQDAIFILCYLIDETGSTLAGMASGRIEQKPYDHYKWLYVDEVDTCANLRQRGVGTALMHKLLEIADDRDCEEVWLGAEASNVVATQFYESLNPTAVDEVIGYTFGL